MTIQILRIFELRGVFELTCMAILDIKGRI
jgi:hypothetical protein